MAVQPIRFRLDDNGNVIEPNRSLSLANTTPLGASATYTQTWIDSTLTYFMNSDGTAGPQDVNFVSGSVLTDQAGTLYLDQTDDANTVAGTASNYFSTSVAVSASTLTEFPLTNIKHKWYRFRYVNGATAQTSFSLGQMSERIDAFDQVGLSGSKEIYYGTNISLPAGGITYIGGTFDLRPYRAISGGLQIEATPGATVDLSYFFADAAGNTNYSSSNITKVPTTGRNNHSGRVDTVSSQAKFYVYNNDTVAHTVNNLALNGWID